LECFFLEKQGFTPVPFQTKRNCTEKLGMLWRHKGIYEFLPGDNGELQGASHLIGGVGREKKMGDAEVTILDYWYESADRWTALVRGRWGP
jgi:hypothetical protein